MKKILYITTQSEFGGVPPEVRNREDKYGCLMLGNAFGFLK